MAKPRFEQSCKLGTVPHLVRLHGPDVPQVDRLVRVQEREGADWMSVLVTLVHADGFFKADLWMSHAPAGGAQPPAGSYCYPA